MALKRNTDSAVLHPVAERSYPRDLAGLVAQLRDADTATRRWAARDLAAYPEATAAMCERLHEEREPSVRDVIFSSVTRLGGPTVVATMMALLRSEDPALRTGAVEVLGALPEDTAPQVERLLADADGDVRIFTVNLLGELRHPRVPQWLLQVLETEPALNVVGAALEVLVEVAPPEAAPALRAVKRRFADDAYIGFAADLALQRIEST